MPLFLQNLLLWHRSGGLKLAMTLLSPGCNSVKPSDWENIAARLSELFFSESTKVELKGRGRRERVDRLIEKFKAEDAKALER